MRSFTNDTAGSLDSAIKGIALFVGLIWLCFLADQFLPLERWGLIPRTFGGLAGIVTLPFLHGNLQHIIGNTVPLVVLLFVLAGSRANSVDIVFLISLLAGIALWLFGGEGIHIGASVLVFGLIGFLICAGFFERRLVSVIVAVGVALTYGSTLLYGVLPMQEGVSWEGHLFGALSGGVIAYYISTELRVQNSR